MKGYYILVFIILCNVVLKGQNDSDKREINVFKSEVNLEIYFHAHEYAYYAGGIGWTGIKNQNSYRIGYISDLMFVQKNISNLRDFKTSGGYLGYHRSLIKQSKWFNLSAGINANYLFSYYLEDDYMINDKTGEVYHSVLTHQRKLIEICAESKLSFIINRSSLYIDTGVLYYNNRIGYDASGVGVKGALGWSYIVR